MDISVIIPFLNERESVGELFDRVRAVMARLGRSHEIIFVNDGSTDGGERVVARLARQHGNVRLISFRTNFGKAAALSAGFRHAAGRIIITLDADLQDDPAEIPRFVAEIDSGADVVCGWKKVRNDPLSKTLPSRLFNAIVNRVFGLRLRDHNCGFKAYRREALAQVNLYGELHRFIPALLHSRGYELREMPVRHHARRHGHSKYGFGRLFKGALDLLTVALTTRYGMRPLHMFGSLGLIMAGIGSLILTYLSVLWLFDMGPIGTRPLFFLGILLILFGGQLIGTGLLGELFLTHRIREEDKYDIREIVGEDPMSPALAASRNTVRAIERDMAV